MICVCDMSVCNCKNPNEYVVQNVWKIVGSIPLILDFLLKIKHNNKVK